MSVFFKENTKKKHKKTPQKRTFDGIFPSDDAIGEGGEENAVQKGWEGTFFGWEAVLFHNAFSSCFLLLFFHFSSIFLPLRQVYPMPVGEKNGGAVEWLCVAVDRA